MAARCLSLEHPPNASPPLQRAHLRALLKADPSISTRRVVDSLLDEFGWQARALCVDQWYTQVKKRVRNLRNSGERMF